MSTAEKFIKEVSYLKGEVMNDPQTWSETDVSGYGGGGFGGRTTNVRISSKTNTWTSFLIETEAGKEFMVKWPESAPVRKGHHIKVAVFRDRAIALVNEKTDAARHITSFEGVIKWWSEAKAFSTPVAYGGLLVALFLSIPTFGLALFIWLLFAGHKKKKVYMSGGGLGEKALSILQTK